MIHAPRTDRATIHAFDNRVMQHTHVRTRAHPRGPTHALTLAAAAPARHVWLRWFATLVVLAALALHAGAAFADPPGRVGRIAQSEGTVWMVDDARGEWVQATRNHPVTSGDRFSVGQDGRTMIQIGSALLRLDHDTELEVVRIDDARVRLHLHGGSAALQLPYADSAREFEIATAEGVVRPSGRSHFRVDQRDGTTTATAWDGSLHFESADSQLTVPHGQRAEFWGERGRTHYSLGRIERDAFTDWVVASERREGTLAQRHVSPEMTGVHELDRHGQWDTHPQYGTVWYPTTVTSDWAPYRHGRWTWVEPWGWTWIDEAPWGFAPFHYGRWVEWRGRWVWAPGSYVARPVYAPALVAWFGGSNVSVRVSVGNPHLAWVPLAPFEVYSPWFVASTVWVGHINHHPWHRVNGYHSHRHDDWTNRRIITTVPQRVVVDRLPVRQDVITPAQVAIIRGAPPSRGQVAPASGDARRDANGLPPVSRAPAFAPPRPTDVRVVHSATASPANAPSVAAPAQAPGSTRVVPWLRGAPPAVVATPSQGQQPVRVDAGRQMPGRDTMGAPPVRDNPGRENVIVMPSSPDRTAPPARGAPGAVAGSAQPVEVRPTPQPSRSAPIQTYEHDQRVEMPQPQPQRSPAPVLVPQQQPQAPVMRPQPPMQAPVPVETHRQRELPGRAAPPAVISMPPQQSAPAPMPVPQVMAPQRPMVVPQQPQPPQQQRPRRDDDDDRPRQGPRGPRDVQLERR
jgi:hypothetical protein